MFFHAADSLAHLVVKVYYTVWNCSPYRFGGAFPGKEKALGEKFSDGILLSGYFAVFVCRTGSILFGTPFVAVPGTDVRRFRVADSRSGFRV